MKTIIPSILELLKNPNINDGILDAFFDLEPIPDKYQIEANKDLRNKLRDEISCKPFSIDSHGAYVMYSEYQRIVSESMECPLKTFELIKEKYAIGFRDGYFNFEKEILAPKAKIFSTEEHKSQIIFDHISRGYPKAFEGPAFVLDGFDRGEDDDPIPSYFSSVYDTGVIRGSFYRAWYIILENHKIFEDFFNKHNVEKKPRERIKTTYKSDLSDKQILVLNDHLKKNKFIHNETNIDLFRSVFREVEFDTVTNKIDWIGTNKLLAYFIDTLIDKDFVRPENQWEIAEHCFTKSKNLAQASWKNTDSDTPPKRGDELFDIISGL